MAGRLALCLGEGVSAGCLNVLGDIVEILCDVKPVPSLLLRSRASVGVKCFQYLNDSRHIWIVSRDFIRTVWHNLASGTIFIGM